VVDPVDGMQVVLPLSTVSLPAMGSAHAPFFLSMSRARVHGNFPVRVNVYREDDASHPVEVRGTFVGPL